MEHPQTAVASRHVTRVHRYTLAQVLEYTSVPQVRVTRWLAAGIIEPVGGGGSQGIRREFSLKNLVEIVCCSQLHTMGLTEPARQIFVLLLNTLWAQPTIRISNVDPTSLTFREAPFVWFGAQTVLTKTGSQETLVLQPCDLPTVERFLTGKLASNLPTMAQSGIVIPLAQYTRELEARTGDVLVWG